MKGTIIDAFEQRPIDIDDVYGGQNESNKHNKTINAIKA